ncbi:MAG TPA: biotin/lipoyl-binding protein, partial [Anaerolineales bacterium]|nr:biotin/lipoyl-binding protein [Anaerolineales bacterium]
MKQNLTVNNQVYEVDIEDINARPVVVHVDGVRFEVMPEKQSQASPKKEAEKRIESESYKPNPAPVPAPSPHLALSGNSLTSPLPGTVVNIFVKAGDKVEAGQVVLVIEAMKMKNSIRSTYSGTVSDVLVSEGQIVAHKQALIK